MAADLRRMGLRRERVLAAHLGNTPAVARASYVDPRVVDLYHDGVIVPVPDADDGQRVEAAVLELLRDA